MTIRVIGRHIREGCKNLVRNGWMTFASVSAVAITLLILGVSLVVALNAQQLSRYVAGQVEINVFLQPSLTDAQGKQIADEVRRLPGVSSVEFISKEKGLQQLRKDIGSQYRDVLGALSDKNPLPVQLIVKASDPRQTVGVGEEIRSLPGVQKVNDGKSFVDKLFSFLDAVRNIGLVFVAGLVLTAMFLISNTIKITIFARRREIEIMKLVGATNWFVRWPFIWEGILIGVIGTAIPYAMIVYGYQSLFTRAGGVFFALAFPLLPTAEVAVRLAEVLFGVGLLIGVWGGVMSVRKFLRV
ncbi:MAG: permease-like cell division protein FtsX [Alicyclobacillus sp.]|nr:permease-like cell division protein FtsX [Alicyclobacillus sp.]